LTPFGDNQRYDLVVDLRTKFLKIQCKTGRIKAGAIIFPTSSSQAHRGKGRQSYRGQIDLFAVYCPENRRVYVVPVDDVGTCEGSLRIEATKNNQTIGCRMAADYDLQSLVLV